jgi:hypothetical protein
MNDTWIKIENKYKNTCSYCNRAMFTGDLILWNPETMDSKHLPEMCEWLGIRAKMPKRRKVNS